LGGGDLGGDNRSGGGSSDGQRGQCAGQEPCSRVPRVSCARSTRSHWSFSSGPLLRCGAGGMSGSVFPQPWWHPAYDAVTEKCNLIFTTFLVAYITE